MDVQFVPPVPSANTIHQAASAKLMPGGMLVSAVPHTNPCNDYDPNWFIYAHPTSFPHGVGQCPKGVSLERWARCILLRHPRAQFARNLGLIADLWNIIQRHRVNTHAWVQLRLTPRMAASITSLTSSDLESVLDILSKPSSAAWSNLSPSARILLDGMKRAGGRVQGSPQSFLSLRSKVLAVNTVFGSYTTMINLNPSELNMHWTFVLAGHPYKFDAFGKPNGRLPQLDCLRVVAADPVACAQAIRAMMAAFVDVFLGWPMGSKRQVNAACLFGLILALYLKYEDSGRGSLHGHGQALQPVLQATRLREIFEQSEEMQQRLFEFMESFATAYLPWPGSPVQGRDSRNPFMVNTLVKNSE